MGDKPRETLQCWGYGEDHWLKNCPYQNGSAKDVHNIQEDELVGEVAKTILRIYVALEETINQLWLRFQR